MHLVNCTDHFLLNMIDWSNWSSDNDFINAKIQKMGPEYVARTI